MDLRSIINSDNSNSSAAARPPTKSASPVKSYLQKQQNLYESPSSGQGSGHIGRPPQPPPLQPPSQRDLQSPTDSISYNSTQSPYQYTSASSINGTQYPFPQNTGRSPANGSSIPSYSQREHTTTVVAPKSQSYGQPNPSPFTPTTNTPGNIQNYTQYPRPASSHASTPTSAQSHTQNSSRDGPQPMQTHIHIQTHSTSSQAYQSQPGTPLGPPPPMGRPIANIQRDKSGSYPYDHHRNLSGSSYGHQQSEQPSPTNDMSISMTASPTAYSSRQPSLTSRGYLTDQDRERSLSVSPKTRLPSQTRIGSNDIAPDSSRTCSGQVTPAKRKAADLLPEEQTPPLLLQQDRKPDQTHISSNSANGIFEHNQMSKETLSNQEPQRVNILSPIMATASGPTRFTRDFDHSIPQGTLNSTSSPVRSSRRSQTTPKPLNQQTVPLQTSPILPSIQNMNLAFPPPALPVTAMQQSNAVQDNASVASFSSRQQPTRKRPRNDDGIPIYARKASRGNRGNPLLPNRRIQAAKGSVTAKHEPVVKDEPIVKQEPTDTNSQLAQQVITRRIKDEVNGNSLPNADVVLPKTQPEFKGQGPLGPWEPTILNIFPHDEVTRVISDFLFNEVVLREDVGAGPAGGGAEKGAILEIEAKIGQLIDKNTNDRLRLPVMTDCVVSKDDPNLRINFKSSMTETQHRALNGFLNTALLKSKGLPAPASPPTKPRIPMTYVHTKERDTFYELSQSGQLSLPASIRSQLNPRHNKAKVRITTDQDSRVLAKIIKVRVADIDIYSPRTAFDWRVSVNLEMNFDGDMKDLVEVQEGHKRPDRNKDRVSYKHLAYQIDLTQVTTPIEATSKADKEHELEIEVSSAEIRRQGLLAKTGQTNQYEELVKGFVGNVRVLARHCQ